jgi:hypothetical protein
MKKTTISVLIILVCQFAIGQSISKQVIGAAGKTQSNGSHKISWTAGEPIVGLMSAGGNQLGNGYYPSLDVKALSKEDFTMDVSLKVYPNPTTQLLFASQKDQHHLEIKLIDLSGKLLLNTKINTGEAIDVSKYTNGMYLIEVKDIETNKKNTYKIIKN